jgi:hypothetical protein
LQRRLFPITATPPPHPRRWVLHGGSATEKRRRRPIYRGGRETGRFEKTGRTREPILKKEQRKKQLKSTAYVVFLFDFAGHRCRREEKEKKPVSACCFPGGRAATVAAIPEVFLCNSCSFGGLFCKV